MYSKKNEELIQTQNLCNFENIIFQDVMLSNI